MNRNNLCQYVVTGGVVVVMLYIVLRLESVYIVDGPQKVSNSTVTYTEWEFYRDQCVAIGGKYVVSALGYEDCLY